MEILESSLRVSYYMVSEMIMSRQSKMQFSQVVQSVRTNLQQLC
jgi:hypothetical protein